MSEGACCSSGPVCTLGIPNSGLKLCDGTNINPELLQFEQDKELNAIYDILNQYALRTDLIQHFFRELYILADKNWKSHEEIKNIPSDSNGYTLSLYNEITNILSIIAIYYKKIGGQYTDNIFIKTLKNSINFKPLSPLKFDDKEFESVPSEACTLQNIRLSGIIKRTYNPDVIYDINALKCIKVGYYDLNNNDYQIRYNSNQLGNTPICFWKEKEKRWFVSNCICKIKNKELFIGEYQNTPVYCIEVNNIPHYINGIYIASYDDIPRIFFRDYELIEKLYDDSNDTYDIPRYIKDNINEYLNVCNTFSDLFVSILNRMYEK